MLLHDLSNALGAARMRLHLVLDMIAPGEANQHLTAAESSVVRAVALLGRIRALVGDGAGAKPAKGKAQPATARRNGRGAGG